MDVHIGLGSNLGDRMRHLREAVAALEGLGLAPRAISSVWHTEAVGTADGRSFFNMVVCCPSEGSPLDLLDLLHRVESRAGRVRRVRNGPRTLDLDLLLMGDLVLSHPRLTLPHPRMWQRRFVLAPLAEIAADLVNPATGRTVEQELLRLGERPAARRLGRLIRV